MDGATADLDHVAEEIDDAARDLSARTPAQSKLLAQSRINRARLRLIEARKQRAQLRELLLLDEDDDGLS